MSVLTLLFALTTYPQKVHLVGTTFGTKVGTMEVSIDRERGFVLQTIHMNLNMQNHQTILDNVEEIALSGRVNWETQRQVSDGKVVSDVKVTYVGRTAIVKDNLAKNGYMTRDHRIVAPSGESIENPSALWFITNVPKPSQALVRATTFYTDKLEWENVTRSYRRNVQVKYGDKNVWGHEIEDNIGGERLVSVVDDRSLPYQVTIGNILFVRDRG